MDILRIIILEPILKTGNLQQLLIVHGVSSESIKSKFCLKELTQAYNKGLSIFSLCESKANIKIPKDLKKVLSETIPIGSIIDL